MKKYNVQEYEKLHGEMQNSWEKLLAASLDLFPINKSHPEYAKFYEAELKVRKYYVAWHASGDMIYKPCHLSTVIYLNGYAAAYPEIEQFNKTGNPTVRLQKSIKR